MNLVKIFEKTGAEVVADIEGSKLTSFGSGGKIKYLLFPDSEKSLIKTVCALKDGGIAYTVIGNCTNLLIADGGYDGALISLARLNKTTIEGDNVLAGAGANLGAVINLAEGHGLSGLEFADGIPATVGGAVAMNAGAFGKEIGDKVVKVSVLKGYNVITLKNGDMEFRYRGSSVEQNNYVVLSAVFALNNGDVKEIRRIRSEYRIRRAERQPQGKSAGSVFKSCDGVSAGFYIDRVGLKGCRTGGAEISAKHANFIINTGGATTADFIRLAETAEKAVYEKYGITLQREVRLIGE